MLELLQLERFRTSLKRADFMDHIFGQQFLHWKHRTVESQTSAEQAQPPREQTDVQNGASRPDEQPPRTQYPEPA